MANNYEQIMELVNAGNKMGLSNAITRDNGIPLDLSSVYNTYEDAVVYAATKAIAYHNQVIAAEGVVYVIVADSRGKVKIGEVEYDNYLKPVGTAPTGDNASITVTAEGLVSVFGFAGAQNGMIPVRENGVLTWKTLEAIGAGDGNDNTTYQFALNEGGNGIVVTPLFNGQPIYDGDGEDAPQIKYEVVLDVYTKGEADGKFLAKADYAPYDDTELTDRVKALEDEERYDETPLVNRVTAIEETLGDAEGGLVKDVADNATAIATEKARAEAAEAKVLEDAKAYTADEIEGLDVSIEKKSNVDYLVIKNKAGAEVASVDATPFIKDGMLESAEYNAETKKLILTWNTAAGITSTEIDLNGLVDTYTGGTGITVGTDGVISVDGTIATVEALNGVKATAEAAQTADQVAQAIATAIADYTKTADVNAALALKADKTALDNYYTKDDVDGKGFAVAEDVATTYATKEEFEAHTTNAANTYAVKADVETALNKKIETGSIAHSSESLAEGVTVSGTKLNIVVDAYTKEETLAKIQEKITEVNGGESAGEVLSQLNSYKETNDARVGAVETKNTEQGTAIAAAQTQADKGVADAANVAADLATANTAIEALQTIVSGANGHASRIVALEGSTASLASEDTRLARLIDTKANATDVYNKTEADEAIRVNLQAAKDSGEFDGKDGADGGHYTPSVKDNGNGTMTVSFTSSKSGMPSVNPITITLPAGKDGTDGNDGEDGADGGYYTPSVQTMTDTTFKISFTASKSGMPVVGDVTITLPIAKDGEDGSDGVGIESIVQTTTSPTDGGENVITVTLTNGNTSTFKVKNGSRGSTGKTAFQYAQGAGYTGSETEFASKLANDEIYFGDDEVMPEECNLQIYSDGNEEFGEYAPVDHNHDGTYAKPSDIPTKLPNPNPLTINGKTYDGSKAVSVTVDGSSSGEEIPTIVLPSKLYAVEGHEFVLYYRNILQAMRPDDFVVSAKITNTAITNLKPLYADYIRFTPTASLVGQHTITILVKSRRTWVTVAEKSVTLVISADRTFTGKRVMYIGDSLTFAAVYAKEVQDMSGGGIVSVGTITDKSVPTEGRNSATSYGYTNSTHITSDYPNPFYNPNKSYTLEMDAKYEVSSTDGVSQAIPMDNSGDKTVITHHFDFAYYMANHGATVGELDAVFINLGNNGWAPNSFATSYMGMYAMVDRIRAYSADLPIFIHLFIPKSEAGSIERNFSGQFDGLLNKRTHYYRVIQYYIEKWENDPRVTLVPTYTMVDTVYDFKRETVAVSARNPIEVTMGQNDGVHPATPGYLHMADSYYNILQALWSGEPIDTYYAVTNNLSNVTNSNTATSVKKGNSYTAKLTAASGYTLDTVSVTMEGSDGSDITVTDDGVISIESVTGKIVITATAVENEEPEEPTVENLVDPTKTGSDFTVGADLWVDGYYLSSGTNASTALAQDTNGYGLITTDQFPITDSSVIRIRGLDYTNGNVKARTKMAIGMSNGDIFRGMTLPFVETTDGSGATLLDGDGSLLVTVSKFGKASDWKGKAWARICGKPKDGNNANIVVTVE